MSWIAQLTLTAPEIFWGPVNSIYLSRPADKDSADQSGWRQLLERSSRLAGRWIPAPLHAEIIRVLLLEPGFSINSMIPAVEMVKVVSLLINAEIITAGLTIIPCSLIHVFVSQLFRIEIPIRIFLLLIDDQLPGAGEVILYPAPAAFWNPEKG